MSLSILSLWEKGKRYHFSSRMKQLPLPPGERRAGLPLTRQCHGGRCKGAWIPACAGRTLWPPHPAVPWAPPASPAVGRGVLDCCLRRNDTGGGCKEAWTAACAGRTRGPPHPASLDGWPPSPAGGEAYWTASCAGMTRGPPSPGGALGNAGLSRGGERRTGLLLAQE